MWLILFDLWDEIFFFFLNAVLAVAELANHDAHLCFSLEIY